MPTRFSTGGVKVFFSVMSLSNKNMLFVHHCQWRIAKARSIQSKYLCHSTTMLCHSSSSTQVPSGKDTAISFKAKVASQNFWSAAGLTMRVGGAWAKIAQTATITKISTDYEEKVNQRSKGSPSYLVSGISVLQIYCSTRGARFIPFTELEKYCL